LCYIPENHAQFEIRLEPFKVYRCTQEDAMKNNLDDRPEPSPAMNVERKVLLISAIGCLVIGCVGVAFSAISGSEAILLDGFFNLIYFATGLFTLRVARLVQRGDDETFPMGYGYFEPLVNGLKGVLVLGISVMALAGAMEALFTGGRAIEAGPAIGYGVFAATAGWLLAIVSRVGANRTGSPLVRADAENWIVNAAISSAVLLTFLSLILIRGTALEPLAPYVDPAVVVVVVAISISVPIRMAWQAIMELVNRAPPPEVVAQVNETIAACTAELPVREMFVRIVQPGRTRMVLAHVVLPEDFPVEGLPQLDALRTKTLDALQKAHLATFLDIIFTADPALGAPAGFKQR
jgi:cation diffusion facilitator family transporter